MPKALTDGDLLLLQAFGQEVQLYVTHFHPDPQTLSLYKLDSLTDTVHVHTCIMRNGCKLMRQMLEEREDSPSFGCSMPTVTTGL